MELEGESVAFMVDHGAPPEMWENVGKLSVGRREGRKMASMMKVIEGPRMKRDAIFDKRPRPRGFPDRSHVADT